MRQCGGALLLMAAALLPACSQETAPRQEAPRAVAARNATAPAVETGEAGWADETESASVPELTAVIREEADPLQRSAAIYAMADAGAAEDAAIIGEALYDPDAEVRLAAVHALTGIGGQASAVWLSLGLGDPDPHVRETAVEALGEVGGDTAKFLLHQALTDADLRVREKAREMLEEPALARRESGNRFSQ